MIETEIDVPRPGTVPVPEVRVLPGASPVPSALEELRSGRPVVVLDDIDRENEGDLIFAAELATPELLSFVVRHTSGFVCVALPPGECARLQLDAMPVDNRDRFGTAYRVTVDLVGTGTGISATARAATIAALGSTRSTAADFSRPGHVVPLQARAGGVLERRGHTEAAVDLAALAGLRPAGGLCEIVSTRDSGAMARGDELLQFAAEHRLAVVTIEDIVEHRLRTERIVERGAAVALPTRHGSFRAIGYRSTIDGEEHLAVLAADIDPTGETPVHVHHECLRGDVFGAAGCDCNLLLTGALDEFGTTSRGVVVYLRSRRPGTCRPDRSGAERSASVAAAILEDLGVRRACLFDPSPAQHAALHARGIASSDRPANTWRRRTIA